MLSDDGYGYDRVDFVLEGVSRRMQYARDYRYAPHWRSHRLAYRNILWAKQALERLLAEYYSQGEEKWEGLEDEDRE